jgi:ATP-dependent Clp protease protease subunit
MSRPMGTWPPRPPQPPDPPAPPPSPWQPGPRPVAPGPTTASASLTIGMQDLLEERLLAQRMVALAGELDAETVNRTVATLALFDADGDAPVRLRLSGVSADLDAVLTVVDALDLMSVPVHAAALGTITGPAIAILAVADHRTAGQHAVLHLCEPRQPRGIHGQGLDSWVAEQARRLRRLQERMADACARTAAELAADMAAGRVLTAREAEEYGLVDAIGSGGTGPAAAGS